MAIPNTNINRCRITWMACSTTWRSKRPARTYTYQPPRACRTERNYANTRSRFTNARGYRFVAGSSGLRQSHIRKTAVANFTMKTRCARLLSGSRTLVKEFTGAVKVHVFDHNVRYRRWRSARDGAQEPVKVAHNDYTLKSGPQRVRDLLPNEADALSKIASR